MRTAIACLRRYRERHGALTEAIAQARAAGLPIVYANDNDGAWNSDAPALVEHAVEQGKAGPLVEAVAPKPGDTVVLKPRYSAFDATPLESILRRELAVDELVVAGSATELCVFQTVTDGLRLGFDLSVRANACATVDEENERLALDYLGRVLGVEIAGR
jgi:nicotinamidase-related amidase